VVGMAPPAGAVAQAVQSGLSAHMTVCYRDCAAAPPPVDGL
jgi:hypothetical protein